MAFAFDKPLRDFLQNFQKDLNLLQKKLKQESDELVHKAKAAANKDSLNARRKDIEKLLEQKLTKLEPSINKFVHELNSTAKKAGVDLGDLEKRVSGKLATARGKLAKEGAGTKSRSRKGAASEGKAKRAPAKKTAGKKAAAKKAAPAAAAAAVVEAPVVAPTPAAEPSVPA